MTFRPVLPFSGYAGWTYLKRSRDTQQAVFDKSAQIQRETAHFKDKIGSVRTAEALVGDRRLLQVALGAYGLDGDINNRFFVRKVLQDGSLNDTALANRLADKRYLELARGFGFGDFSTPNTLLSTFGDEITKAYRNRQFEVAVGEQDPNLRLALGLDRDIDTVLARQSSDDGRWFAVMGNLGLRKVFETALGLPSSFGRLDIDRQLNGFRQAAQRVFGNGEVAQFADPEAQEKLIRLFLVRSEIQSGSAATSAGMAALTLLQNAGSLRQR